MFDLRVRLTLVQNLVVVLDRLHGARNLVSVRSFPSRKAGLLVSLRNFRDQSSKEFIEYTPLCRTGINRLVVVVEGCWSYLKTPPSQY